MHAIETWESQVPTLGPVGGEWSASHATRFARYTFSRRLWRKEKPLAPDWDGTSVSFSLALWSKLYTDCTITA